MATPALDKGTITSYTSFKLRDLSSEKPVEDDLSKLFLNAFKGTSATAAPAPFPHEVTILVQLRTSEFIRNPQENGGLPSFSAIKLKENNGEIQSHELTKGGGYVFLAPRAIERELAQTPTTYSHNENVSFVNLLDAPARHQAIFGENDDEIRMQATQKEQYTRLRQEHRILPLSRIWDVAQTAIQNGTAKVTVDWSSLGQAPTVTKGWS